MNYLELKHSLGIKPTQIDSGFEDGGYSKYAENDYLPVNTRDRRARRAPAGEDLSHLNSPDFRSKQHFVKRPGSGRKARK